MSGAKDHHVISAMGLAEVVIENGRVVSVTAPKIDYCPLFKKYRNLDQLTADEVKKNMELRIREFGFCSPNRQTRMGDFITFGVSEILATALHNGVIDAAVIVSDGCGTAVISDPEIVQGLCGRISGIHETSPIAKVINDVGADRVLNPKTACIDQLWGAVKAAQMGFRKFAVTVSNGSDAAVIRSKYSDRAVVIGVHTTGVSRAGAEQMFDNCDIISACASGPLHELASERKDTLIAGNKVPIYGVTPFGKKLVLYKLHSIGREPWYGQPAADPARPLF